MKRPKRISVADWNAVRSPALKDRELKGLRPAVQVVPDVVIAARRLRGRPKQAITKELVSMRLSPAVLEHFRGQGPGWQTRINAVLEAVVSVGTASGGEAAKKLLDYIDRNLLPSRSAFRARRKSSVIAAARRRAAAAHTGSPGRSRSSASS